MTGATKRIKLAIEPVAGVGGTEAQAKVGAGVDAAFARVPDLVDVGPDGTRYYDTPEDQSHRASLSTRLTRLWQERGDFSLFSTKALEAQIRQKEGQDSVKFESPGEVHKEEREWWTEDAAEGSAQGGAENESSQENRSLPGMTLKEFNELKGSLLQQLVAARHSASFADALVSILLSSARANGSSNAAAPTSTNTEGLAAPRARLASPSGSSSAGRKAPGSLVASTNAMPTSLVEELGLDPTGMGATSLRPEVLGLGVDDADPEGDETTALKRARLPESIQNLPPAERAYELKLIVASKRATVRSAADILKAGASLLSRPKAAEPIGPEGPEAERSAAGDLEQVRHATLLGARKRGWGLTPGRVFRQGWSGDPENEEALWTDEGPHRREDGINTGARDAWIGWGIPEAPPAYRSRTLAFVSDQPSTPERSYGAVGGKTLVFPDRPRKRLKVSFIMRRRSSMEDPQNDRSGTTIMHSDVILSGIDDSVEASLDESLQAAQNEMADQELFDDLVRQARMLSVSSTQSTPAARSNPTARNAGQAKAVPPSAPTFSPDAVKVTPTRLDLTLTGTVSIRFELVPTIFSLAKSKKNGVDEEGKDMESDAEILPSALAALVLSLARLGLVRRYRRRAGLGKSALGNAQAAASHADPGILRALLDFAQYASLASRVHDTLSRLSEPYRQPEGDTSRPLVRLYWDPLSSMSDSASWLSQLVEGSTSRVMSSAGGAGDSEGERSPAESLGGNAAMWLGDVPIANITLRAPSQLAVHFPRIPAALSAQLARAYRDVSVGGSKDAEGKTDSAARRNDDGENDLQGQAEGEKDRRREVAPEGTVRGDGLGVTMSGITMRSLEEFVAKRLADLLQRPI